ncbi:MAG: DUF979 domain-containing protein [Brevinema sp.]
MEIFYIFGGLIAVMTGIYAFKDPNNTTRIGTGIFWIVFGMVFIIGRWIPPILVGICLLILAFLTATKQVKITVLPDTSDNYKKEQSLKIGNKIWLPTLSIGFIAMLLSPMKYVGGLVALGISSVIAFLLAAYFTKDSLKKGYGYDAPRLLHGMGAAVILPQVLGSLGTIFARSGVGEVVADMMSNLIPIGDPLTGVILYCVSMALFTMIMGNAFAAFAVITAGIGVPFVINLGANPAIVGALGITAGYCGTLMTPMAANFNIVPASIMEIQDKYRIIKTQIPFALILLVVHIIIMYFLAF